jgi:hypothetical protein
MPTLGFRAVTVGVPGAVRLGVRSTQLAVAELVAELALGDGSVLNGRDQVVGGPAEVLADRLAVIGDNCNAHDVLSPGKWI